MAKQLTALIPAKNERDNIGACVASVRSVADEVLLADSGSTDGTIEIARRLGCRVIEREYIDSGDFKNWAIPQARHGWVLVVDADERITPALACEIRALLSSQPDKEAYRIRRRNFFLGYPIDHGDWARDRVTRLLQRDKCRYACYTDHAEIDLPREQIGALRQRMVHYTAWNLDDYLVKMTRYATQQAELWHQRGKTPSFWNLSFNAPLRFLRGYVLRGGFLDGPVGFQIASLTAYYSFMKQAQLWQRWHGRTLRDTEPDYAAGRSVQAAPAGNPMNEAA